MTIFPVKHILDSEMSELGMSFAHVALADNDEELKSALDDLGNALRKLANSIGENAKSVERLEVNLPRLSGYRIQKALEILGRNEAEHLRIVERWSSVFAKIKARSNLKIPDGFGADAFDALFEKWRNVHLPLIRRVRLCAITLVFRRAQERGIEGVQLDAGFAERFLTASPEEADSWQETAHLLAVPENADRLLRSIRMVPQDRTDEISGFAK